MRFPPFDDEEPPLDYVDYLLNVEPGEAVQLDLSDDQYELIRDWFYDPQPLSDIRTQSEDPLLEHVYVHGPSYETCRLCTPVMSQLYKTGRATSEVVPR